MRSLSPLGFGIVTLVMSMAVHPAAAGVSVNDLELIGPDLTPVTQVWFDVGSPPVTIWSSATPPELKAYTYNGSAFAFQGSGGNTNAPLNPGNVSGSRFISTGGSIAVAQPIVFDFDSPVDGFGFTTIDLMEDGDPNAIVTVKAYDASLTTVIASQTRTGPQGSSGLDLDWWVAAPGIKRVVLEASGIANGVNYGIDDLVLAVQDTVCGIKVVDTNGNGVADPGDVPVPGWPIYLSTPSLGIIDSTVTDSSGQFCFVGTILDSVATVSEGVLPGWENVCPAGGSYTFAIPYLGQGNWTFCNTVPGCVPIADSSLVGWWPLDDPDSSATVSDLSIYGTNGNYFGPSRISGRVGPARSFVFSQGDYVEIPYAPEFTFGMGNFSVDAWIRTSDKSGTRVILDHRQAWGRSGYEMYLYLGQLGFQLADQNSYTSYTTATSVADGNWHHVAVTVDRTAPDGLVFYVDGTEVERRDPTGLGSLANSAPIRLGSVSYGAPTPSFDGDLDEVEIFNRVLSPPEVVAIWAAGAKGKCKPLATICGVKFHDANGNGVQDAGEPGLPGWTIQALPVGGGVPVASAVTDSMGQYCISVPPDSYVVAEVLQPNWSVTSPPNGEVSAYFPAQTTTTIDFGNRVASCVPPPSDLKGWWSLSEPDTSSTAHDWAGTVADDGQYVGMTAVPGVVSLARHFDGTGYVSIPSSAETNVGVGDFSIDMWIRSMSPPFSGFGQVVLDKRRDHGRWGYEVFIGYQGQLELQLATDASANYNSGVIITDGAWHHVAITVKRNDPKGLVFYVDGVERRRMDPTPFASSLSNSMPLRLGRFAFTTGYKAEHFVGDLDEVELFHRALTAAEVMAIWAAGANGKCKSPATICGVKFYDNNANGVQDAGEPGLPGWTIEARPVAGGAAVASAVTDSLGQYCLSVPPDSYVVAEVSPSYWAATSPPNGALTGYFGSQTTTSIEFGNRVVSCVPPPNGLQGWWSLSEEGYSSIAYDWGGTNADNGQYVGVNAVSGIVGLARHFDGTGYVSIPSSSETDVGTGDFSLDMWIRSSSPPPPGVARVVLDKRTDHGVSGYEVYIGNNGRLGCQLATASGYKNFDSGVIITDGSWHHVAITVERNDSLGLVFYVDGSIRRRRDPTAYASSLTNTMPLRFGRYAFTNGSVDNHFIGDLDEVELFHRALTPPEVQALWAAGSIGKCRPTTGAGDVPRTRVTRLFQNTPNPFNPTTTIRYELAHRSKVTLSVYSVSGRLVNVLDEGVRPAGVHDVVWDGRDRHGLRAASGVYFYVLRTDDGLSAVRKMVLLK